MNRATDTGGWWVPRSLVVGLVDGRLRRYAPMGPHEAVQAVERPDGSLLVLARPASAGYRGEDTADRVRVLDVLPSGHWRVGALPRAEGSAQGAGIRRDGRQP